MPDIRRQGSPPLNRTHQQDSPSYHQQIHPQFTASTSAIFQTCHRMSASVPSTRLSSKQWKTHQPPNQTNQPKGTSSQLASRSAIADNFYQLLSSLYPQIHTTTQTLMYYLAINLCHSEPPPPPKKKKKKKAQKFTVHSPSSTIPFLSQFLLIPSGFCLKSA